MNTPYYGNLHNADKWPQSRIIPYSLLYIATSVQRKPPFSKLRTLKSCPNGQNQYKFPSETVSTYLCKGVEKYLLFFKTKAVSIHSSTFQGLSALKEHSCMLSFRTCGIQQLERVVTLPGALALCIKDTSLLRTIQHGVRNSEVPLHMEGSSTLSTQTQVNV